MEQNVLLTQMSDIHIENSYSIWPLAPIWWVSTLLFLFLFIAIYFVNRYYFCRRNRYYLARLKKLVFDDSYRAFLDINIILKLFAMDMYGRENVSYLSGEDWLSFLDSKKGNFEFIRFLSWHEALLYKKNNDILDTSILKDYYTEVFRWIKQHKGI